MFNLFDLLQAQGGMGANGFGQQFGLSPDQTRRAMEALMPALTLGLQRNAGADPSDFTQMFSLMDPTTVGSAAGKPQMDAMIRQLFGSQHLSQAVLQQAAAVSGVATPALRQMLPVMAGMVVAGIVHVMMNPASPAPAPAAPPPSPIGIPTPPYWTDMMNAFMGPGSSVLTPSSATTTPQRSLPSARHAVETKAAATAASQASVLNPFDLLQQMFQSGLDAQQENAKTMQSLFDSLWRGGTTESDASKAPTSRSRTAGPQKR
ncbi:DUF937 domain-containing protein [Methylobacterium marchantiae]|uniref:DUF937 domain-containing protein n=1 Tax=Methylobacterium marchantiae TaxID=600331 RepID=A0ABW3X324_9HYPH|nr:hypothetical protein AIGOOFII_3990 [Methylobacterium marchantiae]